MVQPERGEPFKIVDHDPVGPDGVHVFKKPSGGAINHDADA